jgi:hypothetical protein
MEEYATPPRSVHLPARCDTCGQIVRHIKWLLTETHPTREYTKICWPCERIITLTFTEAAALDQAAAIIAACHQVARATAPISIFKQKGGA